MTDNARSSFLIRHYPRNPIIGLFGEPNIEPENTGYSRIMSINTFANSFSTLFFSL